VATCWLLFSSPSYAAKEIALTFDDAPVDSSMHFETNARTDALIKKLKELKVPPVMIFANPCKRENLSIVIRQLKKYRDAGHFIGNHTCSHPRLDDLGFERYSADANKGDTLLTPLFSGQKFFRYPFLNEGKEEPLRDQMRDWLITRHYKNGMVSVDSNDYVFSSRINEAKKRGKKSKLFS
jgi:peptidoglycan/xylan/chitin deacetylase (PgdA/CDA1 family)